jgi:hypothetical protein
MSNSQNTLTITSFIAPSFPTYRRGSHPETHFNYGWSLGEPVFTEDQNQRLFEIFCLPAKIWQQKETEYLQSLGYIVNRLSA